MKKGYYLYVEGCGSSGVMNKIRMQVETFSRHLDIEALQIDTVACGGLTRALNMLPNRSFARDYAAAIDRMSNPDFVYIRRTYIDKAYLHFLAEIHNRWQNCKIIVEQPVYPYDKDMLRTPYTAIQYIKELIYRKHYKDDIDRFVTYSDDEEILGVQTIRTMNGVNVDEIHPVDVSGKYAENAINLITVATLIAHHGYERVIEGLHQYYFNGGKRDVVFHIVGDGPEKAKYFELVRRYELEKHVIFYGAKFGSELDSIYATADAGLAAFGSYKEGVDKLCTIKAREYLAKGLPVVLGCDDNLFLNEASEYALIYPNNATYIDIERLLQFLDGIYLDKGRTNVVRDIRDLAYRTVDNEVTLSPVVEYINS